MFYYSIIQLLFRHLYQVTIITILNQHNVHIILNSFFFNWYLIAVPMTVTLYFHVHRDVGVIVKLYPNQTPVLLHNSQLDHKRVRLPHKPFAYWDIRLNIIPVGTKFVSPVFYILVYFLVPLHQFRFHNEWSNTNNSKLLEINIVLLTSIKI